MVAKIIDFAAGIVGGSCGIIVGQPFDVIKVRMQTSNRYTGIIDCVRQMMKQEGFFSLYRGIVPPIMGVGALNAVLFGTYAAAKRFLHKDQGTQPDLMQIFWCGSIAGFACCSVTTPTELLKCREQIYMTAEQAKVETSTLSQAKHLIKYKGPLGLMTGFWVTAARDIPSYGFYFVVYEAICRKWIGPDPEMNLETFLKLNVAGGAAGLAGWIPVYPIDSVKSRMQTQDLKNPKYKNSIDCARQIIKCEGHAVLWRGLWSAIVRAVPVNAVTFAMYEVALSVFKGFGAESEE